MNTLINVFDDLVNNMFADIDMKMNYDRKNSGLYNTGLKRLIHRPHNLVTITDKDNNITGYRLDVVYTPFTKNDVKVEVANNMLSVTCGDVNKQKELNENYIYCGISYQSYMFALPLDESIEIKQIKAKADDGILKIELPLKEQKIEKSEPLKITVE